MFGRCTSLRVHITVIIIIKIIIIIIIITIIIIIIKINADVYPDSACVATAQA